ncbi:MAG: hypothetical protein ACPGKQ_13075, partial [bacterium]
HPPFAHAGEEILNACMKNVGGFDHNDQSLRVLTDLERKYPNFAGLNMTVSRTPSGKCVPRMRIVWNPSLPSKIFRYPLGAVIL